jgi:thiamine biosynthesis lipoprotein
MEGEQLFQRILQLRWILSLWLICCAAHAAAQQEHLIAGRTMGTRYNIKVVAHSVQKMPLLKQRIEQRLEQINQSMSTYRPDSEISRFNAMRHSGKPFAVSNDFLQVMQAGRYVHQISQGAWDGTVQSLVRLWGFGRRDPIDRLPSAQAIKQAKQLVDFSAIEILPDGHLKKRRAGVTVDLASIAKGYGVDQVAILVSSMGFTQYLVEIGGEVYAAGRRADGKPWRIGINRPRKGGPADAVYRVVALQDQAMATSGDYRNFIEIDGRSYSHIIDPRTGRPVTNGVVSASVIAAGCTLADGLATGLMVMGPQSGLALLNRLDGVEGLIIVRKSDGTLVNHWSKGLEESGR